MDEPKPEAPQNENTSNDSNATPVQPATGSAQTPTGTPDAVKAELSKMAGSEQGQFQSAGNPATPPITQNPPKNSKKLLMIISILVVVALAAGIGYALFHKSNAKKPATTQTTSAAPAPTTTPPPAATPQPVSGHVQTEKQDVERQTDINAIDSHLEAFNADNGFYPTLTNMNTPSWVSTNMKGLDPAWLQDPLGTSQTLVPTPRAKAYAYAPTDDKGNACDGSKVICTKFTLTAVLSNGQLYQKTSH